jgi:hypothetical protein
MATTSALDFSGSGHYFKNTADWTGNANSKSGILSVWFRADGGDGTNRFTVGATSHNFYAQASTTDNKFFILGENTGGATRLRMEGDTATLADSGWHHVIASWNLATPVGHLYLDGAEDLEVGGVLIDDTLDYTQAGWGFAGSWLGGNLWNGAYAEFYFAPGQYLDLSDSDNLEKFIKDGKAVPLGADGSTPTGTQPLVFMDFSTAGENLGSAQNWTVFGPPTATTGPVVYEAPATSNAAVLARANRRRRRRQ